MTQWWTKTEGFALTELVDNNYNVILNVNGRIQNPQTLVTTMQNWNA